MNYSLLSTNLDRQHPKIEMQATEWENAFHLLLDNLFQGLTDKREENGFRKCIFSQGLGVNFNWINDFPISHSIMKHRFL